MKKLLVNSIVFFWSCAFPLITWSQRLPFSFDQIKVGTDAISNQVNCMLKDKNGYLWLGTAAGLKRYDAIYTASFRKKKNDSTSLISNNIEALCEDKQGRIWIATSEGVCYYNRKTNLFTHLEELRQNGAVYNNIICTYNGDIWFSSVDGAFKYDIKKGTIQNFNPSSTAGIKLSSKWVVQHGLVEDPFKRGLWIACSNGFNFYEYSTQRIYNAGYNPKNIKLLNESFPTAPVVHKNKLVFADNKSNQIKWYDVQANNISDSLRPVSALGIPLFYVLQLFFDKSNNLWLSTTDQRAAYIDMEQRKVTDIIYVSGRKNSFSSDKFTDVLQEENNTLWFATANGITTSVGYDVMNTKDKLFDVFDLSNLFIKDEKTLDYFTSIAEDTSGGNWWLTTANNRLIYYNPTTTKFIEWQVPHVKECVNYDFVKSMHNYGKKLLVFKAKAFFIFDKATKQFNTVSLPSSLGNCETFSITHTMLAGDSIWVFVRSRSNEVYCYNMVTKKWKAYPFTTEKTSTELSPTISCVTKKGELVVAVNEKGIAKLSKENNRFEFITPKKAIDFSQLNFTGLNEDSSGNILISTKSELMKLQLANNEIKTILEADFIGALAVSNTGKVCYAALDNLIFYNEARNERIGFQFEVQDAFHLQENKLFNLANGKIISLQKKELIVVNFKEMHLPSFQDQLYINHVFSSDTNLLIHENNSRINFSASQNSFGIDFGMIGPPNTSAYEFYYQLEGFDKDWTYDVQGKRSVTYGNLDGGDYVFKVRATDLNMKTLPEQRLYIHIDTVFYKTKWFIASMLLLIVTAVVLFFRFRINKQREILELENKTYSLEKEKTKVQYENLKQQLNPHFLFNSLSSLRSLIRMNPALATDFLDGLSKTYRYLLRSGDNELVPLHEEINFVQTFVQLQKTRFDEGLQLIIDLPKSLMNNQIAPVTIQGLVENAIKHNTIEDDAPLVIEVKEAENGYIAVTNNLQRYRSVETSNKKGLEALKTLYSYLTNKPVLVEEDEKSFTVKIPLI